MTPDSPNSAGPPEPAPAPGRAKLARWDALLLGPGGMPRAGWRVAAYLVLFSLFLLTFAELEFLFRHMLPAPAGALSPGNLFLQELLAMVAALASAAVMSRIERRPFGDYGLSWTGGATARFWQGALWGIAQISLLMLLIAAVGGYSPGETALDGWEVVHYALAWAVVFCVVGLFEEFFFRGYLQFTLALGLRFWPAATLTSLAFGAAHLSNAGEGPLGVISIFLIGMFLCLTLRRTGSLWFAIGWHAAFDFGETYLYSVPNSGIVMKGQLLGASLHGPAWLTGGSIGPEGSLAAFAVTALAFAVFERVYRSRDGYHRAAQS